MPERKTIERARAAKAEGKSPSTQAGEFVREEIHHIREGKHGARSTKQAIAIGLSKARRAGVKLPSPKRGTAPGKSGSRAKSSSRKGGAGAAGRTVSRTRSRATLKAVQREGRTAASRTALSKQAKTAAKKRTPAQRSASARKAARTRARKK
jgi:hypothetical protein